MLQQYEAIGHIKLIIYEINKCFTVLIVIIVLMLQVHYSLLVFMLYHNRSRNDKSIEINMQNNY